MHILFPCRAAGFRLVRRAAVFLLAALLCMALLVSGTLAWQSVSQQAIGNAYGDGAGFPVTLLKLEKDDAGNATTIPVAGAEFYLYRITLPNDTQIGGRYETDADGKIELGLKAGDYYFTETDPGFGYTYDTDSSGSNITTYPFTVLDGGSGGGNGSAGIIVTAYNRHAGGSLTIQKTAENKNGYPLTQAQLDTEFEFTVTFTDNGTYTYKIDGGAPQNLTSGGKIKLKHGQEAVFESLPVGLRYTVIETPIPGYAMHSVGNSGNITENGAVAAFVNTFSQVLGSLTVTKEVSGAGADVNKDFAFTVTIGGVAQTFTLKHGESKVFDNLPIGTSYSAIEQDYTADGYISNPAAYIGQSTGGDVVLPFDNHLDDGSGDDGALEITKTVTGQGADPAKEFSFIANIGGVDYPFTLKHGETRQFPDIPTGTRYIITEAPENGYAAAITVADGVITSNYTAKVNFVNDKDAVSKDAELIITKKVLGELSAGEENRVFYFTLYVDGQVPVDFELKADESKSFTLPEGTIYNIIEHDASADGYLLTGVINGAGTLDAAQIATQFTNTYVGRVLIKFSGEKTWDFSAAGQLSAGDVNALLPESETAAEAGLVPPATETVANANGQVGDVGDVLITGAVTGYALPLLPDSITLHLKNGNAVVATAICKPDGNGLWHYEWIVPKYEPDGVTVIHYSVEEVPIENYTPSYTVTANGVDIRNSYVPPEVTEPPIEPENPDVSGPGDPTAPKESGKPKTGDGFDADFWFALMCFSALALLRLRIILRK